MNASRSVMLAVLVSCLCGAGAIQLSAQAPGNQSIQENEALQTIKLLQQFGLHRLGLERAILVETAQARGSGQATTTAEFPRLFHEFVFGLSSPDAVDIDILKRATDLLARTPDSDQPEFAVSKLQARFIIAERRFYDEWSDSTIDFTNSETGREFAAILEASREVRSRLEGRLQQHNLLASQSFMDSMSHEALTARYETALARQAFLHGWAAYYTGVMQESERNVALAESDGSFREFLQLDTGSDLESLPDEWLDTFSPWQGRAVLGLGLCLRAMHRDADADWCFETLDDVGFGADLDLNQNLLAWQLRGLCMANRFEDAAALLERVISRADSLDFRQLPLWQTTLETAGLVRRESPTHFERFVRSGLHGLARHANYPDAAHWFDTLHPATTAKDFVDVWIRAIAGRYSPKLSAPRLADIAEFRKRLIAALALANEGTSPLDLGLCRLSLAESELQLNLWPQAIASAAEAAKLLESARRDLAAQAVWIRAQSAIQLSNTSPQFLAEATIALDEIMTRFGDTRFATPAGFERHKLECAQLGTDEAIARWTEIATEPQFHDEAQLERVFASHRNWLDSMKSGETSNGNANTALNNLRAAIANADTLDLATSQKLRLRLVELDILMRITATQSASEGPASFESQLATIRQLRSQLPTLSSVVGESLVYEIAIHERNDQLDRAASLANELIASTADPQMLHRGWAVIAKRLDRQLRDRPEGAKLAADMIDAYQQWQAVLNQSPEVGTGPIRRHVSRRLAGGYLLTNQFSAADQLFDSLLAQGEKDAELIRNAANAKMKLNRGSDAIPLWRMLVAGTAPGSENWREAKLQLATCVSESNRENAQQIVAQTLQIDPQMPDEWRAKFQNLQNKLRADADQPTTTQSPDR